MAGVLVIVSVIPWVILKRNSLPTDELSNFAPISYAKQHPGMLTKLLLPMFITSIGAGLLCPADINEYGLTRLPNLHHGAGGYREPGNGRQPELHGAQLWASGQPNHQRPPAGELRLWSIIHRHHRPVYCGNCDVLLFLFTGTQTA